MKKIISRKEAIAQGLKRYFTGKPCPHGHVVERYVSTYACVECLDTSTKAYRERDYVEPVLSERQKAKAAGRTRYFTGNPCPQGHISDRYVDTGTCVDCIKMWRDEQEYKEREAERARVWRLNNREEHNANARAWRRKNPESYRKTTAKRRPAIAKWDAENPEKVKARTEKYRKTPRAKKLRNDAAKIRHLRMTVQVPAWADKEIMEFFYDEAKRLTEETGIQYVVDHMIPIQGDGVSGLHVETNLQVKTSSANSRKGNRYSHDD